MRVPTKAKAAQASVRLQEWAVTEVVLLHVASRPFSQLTQLTAHPSSDIPCVPLYWLICRLFICPQINAVKGMTV